MAKSRSLYAWPNLDFANMAFQSAMLAIEAQQVIALRLAKMAGAARTCTRKPSLMVSEKLEAIAQGGQMMISAALSGKHDLGADQVVKLYRRKVRANRRRLGM